jgi:hypothetical protein
MRRGGARGNKNAYLENEKREEEEIGEKKRSREWMESTEKPISPQPLSVCYLCGELAIATTVLRAAGNRYSQRIPLASFYLIPQNAPHKSFHLCEDEQIALVLVARSGFRV